MNHDQLVVYELREALKGKWPHPEVFASWAFTVTELSEVGDILLRRGYAGTFVRNREKTATRDRLTIELGQTLLMLCTLANHLGINLSDALLRAAKQQSRKFGQEIFAGPVRKFRIVDDDVVEIVYGKTDMTYQFDAAGDADRTVVFNLEVWQNAVRDEIEFRLDQMGFNTSKVDVPIPLQAFWTALEAAIGSDSSE